MPDSFLLKYPMFLASKHPLCAAHMFITAVPPFSAFPPHTYYFALSFFPCNCCHIPHSPGLAGACFLQRTPAHSHVAGAPHKELPAPLQCLQATWEPAVTAYPNACPSFPSMDQGGASNLQTMPWPAPASMGWGGSPGIGWWKGGAAASACPQARCPPVPPHQSFHPTAEPGTKPRANLNRQY